MAVHTTEVVKRGFGRPTKMTPELIEQAWKYVQQTSDFSYPMLPTIEGLSLAMNISRETIYKWSEDDINKEFSDIVKKLRSSQAEKLIQMSLVGRYNPMISKLMLSKHGYVEKSETDTKIRVIQPIMSLEENNALPGNIGNQEDQATDEAD